MDDTIRQLQEWLASPRRIAITTHQKPDADALGSSLALYLYLQARGHKVEVVSPTDFPDFLRWLPGVQHIHIGPSDPDRAAWIFEGADLIFCLDLNWLNRVNEFEKTVRNSEARKVMIDHHMEPEGFEDLSYSDEKASSTAELIYRLIHDLGDGSLITPEIAENIYTGMMTDTGSFRYTNTSPQVHRIAAHLMELGVDSHRAYENIYSNSSPERLRFIGHCLSNCLVVLPQYKTAYIKVDREVFRQFTIRTGDTEGLVNYALGIKDVNLGVLMTTQDDMVKLSFRSRNEVPAAEFAKEFGGGGHFYAAGGKSLLSLADTEKKFLDLLEAHKSYLQLD
ncbi:MAG: bifunctional oligoribonuclease/PAP phosphatase NrnA [Bacteroidia bacterium]|nr:bifunctional oligoribonuclease/PAP phosphatase NrnA [Bacteroidia bacterium]